MSEAQKKYYKKNRAKEKKRAAKYYRENKKKIATRQKKYRKTNIEKVKGQRRKYERVHKTKRTVYHRDHLRRTKGITPKSKCVNGCKVPWEILNKNRLSKTKSVIMCPNCHAKYHWKQGRKKSLRRK